MTDSTSNHSADQAATGRDSTGLDSSPPDPPDSLRPDPELHELPRPQSRARLVTLAILGITTAASMAMAASLVSDARYALARGNPRDLGALSEFEPRASAANRWVRAGGEPLATGVRYQRPLDGDSYRLAQIQGGDNVWVQMRVPAGVGEEHFIPPSSFVGRLMPLEDAGIRYATLGDAILEVGGDADSAWLLVDGESPSTTRWALALEALFLSFAAFCLIGLFRLTRTVRDPT